MNKNFILCILFLILDFGVGTAQKNYTIQNKKAIQHYEQAISFYERQNLAAAQAEIEMALAKETNFVEAWLLKADLYNTQQNFEKEIDCYNKVISINDTYFPYTYFNKGQSEYNIGRYYDAELDFRNSLSQKNFPPQSLNKAEDNLARVQYAIQLLEHPVPFIPVNLGKNINTEYNEYWPSLTADEEFLYWTLRLPISDPVNTLHYHQEDFYFSHFENGNWSSSFPLGTPVNTPGNEGAISITVDGRVCYFTACNLPGGAGRCDLYRAERIGNEWTIPENLGAPINTRANEKQPSISADGKTLYFSSDRNGTLGGMDLWKTTKNDDGSWSEPQNLGTKVNTTGEDESPFIHPDNQTLYFSSSGHYGMGGLDLFISRVDTSGTWQKPKNLGYPLNTFKDESGLIVNARGNEAFFAADRPGGFGLLDLYQFDLPEPVRPVWVTWVKGTITDAMTHKPLKSIIEIIDLANPKIQANTLSDQITGEYLLSLVSERNYMLNVSKDGYLFHSENFSLTSPDSSHKEYILNVNLHAIQKGEKMVLRNIFFESDSYKLKPESTSELDHLVRFLLSQPKVTLELGGHTDNTGSRQKNKILSENRAKSVFEYLISKGIPANRISYKGFADTQPVSDNNTNEGKALNRRTEAVVTSE